MLTFTFNGRALSGFDGDTLASALLANGVSIVGRSVKYHRPRGIMSAGPEETNAIVQLLGDDDEPNCVATMLPLSAGLVVRSVNASPSVEFDLGAIRDSLHRLIPAGFYYKTFMWPTDRWDWYGRHIRKVAGWGSAPAKPAGGRYEHRFHHCDVLVIGAGPAGLSAALHAGRAGARVLLVDDQSEPGGYLLGSSARVDGLAGMEWVSAVVAELDAMPQVVQLSDSSATGCYDQNLVTVLEHRPDKQWLRERLWKVRAKQVVLAAGAIERPLVFADNDRPGIMLAAAASRYCLRFGVRPGRTAVVFTNNNGSYRHAIEMANSGINVAAIVDTRSNVATGVRAIAEDRGIEVLPASWIQRVIGRRRVRAVDVGEHDNHRPGPRIHCDLIAVSGGWNPTIHLYSQSGGKPVYDAETACFVPGAAVSGQIQVGACNGDFGLAECLRNGTAAGVRSAASCGLSGADGTAPDCSVERAPAVEALWEVPLPKPGSRAFLDFNTDVTSNDIRLAVREGYRSVELVKRYTTAGMGIDQGKTGNVNTIGLLADLTGTPPGEVGTTTYRPAYSPISFGAMAGLDNGVTILPWRRTPITDWFLENGGHLDETGALFRRPLYIARSGESARKAVKREALAVRIGVGMYDGTPLGKISVKGAHAVEFLNRVYTNAWDKLPVGRSKFGYMLHDDGRLLDDGVTFRLAEDHYLMSTGSGVADTVLRHLEKLLHCDWPDLDVYLTPVSDQWAVLCVCGPLAREVLHAAEISIDISPHAFRFLDTRYCQVAKMHARVSRVSYTGELSFEIVVPWRRGRELWDALLLAGEEFGITPVGSDTSMLLRTEKAFIAAGLEGDGYANIFDVGMGWLFGKDKDDFIGKRSTERDFNAGGSRPEVVGLLPRNPEFVPPKGAPIIDATAADTSRKMIGMVTIGFFSPIFERSIALAQLSDGRSKIGQTVAIFMKEKIETADVCDPVFYDPDGARMRS